MKFEDYKKRFDELLTNPDTALAGVGTIYEDLEADLTTLDSLASENESLKNTVRELRETNVKLYMQTTGEATEETGDENENEDKEVEKFFDELMKGE